MVEKASFSSVIANRGFLNLWINQILVQLSYNSLNFALIFWVFKLTDSSTAVSGLLFSIYLPAVILGMFTGILVDLMDKKKIIMLVDILLCISFFSLVLLKDFYPAILLITFLVNALGQLYASTEASAIPMIVGKNQLISANSIFSSTLYSTFLLGFGFSGVLIGEYGINFIFISGGIMLFIAFILSFTFPPIVAKYGFDQKQLVGAISTRNFISIRKIGLTEIIKTINLIRGKLSILTSILILAGVQMVIGVLAVLMSPFLEKVLRVKATDASFVILIPLGLGIICGGLILGKLGKRIVRRIVVARSIILSGLLFLIMGIAPVLSPAIRYLPHPRPLPFITQPPLSAVLITGSFILGLALVSILIPSQTTLQENVTDKDRGKVFGLLGVAMSALSLIPVLLVGVLVDVFGVNSIFVGFGLVIFIIGLFGLKPNLFFKKSALPYNIREFLGLGHWKK